MHRRSRNFDAFTGRTVPQLPETTDDELRREIYRRWPTAAPYVTEPSRPPKPSRARSSRSRSACRRSPVGANGDRPANDVIGLRSPAAERGDSCDESSSIAYQTAAAGSRRSTSCVAPGPAERERRRLLKDRVDARSRRPSPLRSHADRGNSPSCGAASAGHVSRTRNSYGPVRNRAPLGTKAVESTGAAVDRDLRSVAQPAEREAERAAEQVRVRVGKLRVGQHQVVVVGRTDEVGQAVDRGESVGERGRG